MNAFEAVMRANTANRSALSSESIFKGLLDFVRIAGKVGLPGPSEGTAQ